MIEVTEEEIDAAVRQMNTEGMITSRLEARMQLMIAKQMQKREIDELIYYR